MRRILLATSLLTAMIAFGTASAFADEYGGWRGHDERGGRHGRFEQRGEDRWQRDSWRQERGDRFDGGWRFDGGRRFDGDRRFGDHGRFDDRSHRGGDRGRYDRDGRGDWHDRYGD